MHLLLALALAVPSAPVQDTPLRMSHGHTRSTVLQYRGAKHWSLKGLLLLSLGGDWHPDGAEIVLDGLKSKDAHLRAYALEALLATDADALRVVSTKPLIEHLVKKSIKDKNDLYAARALELYGEIFLDIDWPEEDPDRKTVEKHWREIRKTYEPEPWGAPPQGARRSVAPPLVERVIVLNEGGLQICLCIDTTGSMQTTIDASAEALQDIAALLSGMTSSFQIGLVEYKDYESNPNAQLSVAARITKLEKDVEKVFKRLSHLQAIGGGDIPERVELGLEIALDEKMGWEREANKLIIVIGDAPPHPEEEERTIELARQAHEKPFGVEPTLIAPKEHKKGRSIARSAVVRPWVVSTICVGQGGRNPQAERTFRAIAEAGGGVFATLTLPHPDRNVPASMLSKNPSQDILRNVLIQSFGPKHESRIGQFIDVFFEYDDAEYWKKRR